MLEIFFLGFGMVVSFFSSGCFEKLRKVEWLFKYDVSHCRKEWCIPFDHYEIFQMQSNLKKLGQPFTQELH